MTDEYMHSMGSLFELREGKSSLNYSFIDVSLWILNCVLKLILKRILDFFLPTTKFFLL